MSNTLVLREELALPKSANAAIGFVFFILATVLGAYVRIPLPGTPVPMTLQTLFVCLSGAVLGKKLGPASQAAYIFLGAMGLPVFQGYGYGYAHILGPTGGYLIGFVAASYLSGALLAGRPLGLFRITASFMAGIAVLYGLGVTWLMALYGIGPVNAIIIGLVPFAAAETVKMSAAVIIYRAIAPRLS